MKLLPYAEGYIVIPEEDYSQLSRSELQDRKMHAMCGDLSRQVKWMVNGIMTYMSKDDWRHFMVAHIRKQMMAPSVDGDFMVIFSGSSKSLCIAEKAQMIDLMYALGTDKGVIWSEPRLVEYELYKEAA